MTYIFEQIDGFPMHAIEVVDNETAGKIRVNELRKNNDKCMTKYFCMNKVDY